MTEEAINIESSALAQTKGSKSRNKANRATAKAKKANSAKQTSRAKRSAKPEKRTRSAREGSKTEKVIELLKRSGGATLEELMQATEWQQHSVRGFLSGTIGKKMGLKLISTRDEETGERRYSVKS
jgi:Protein of unknown function (DUF3489)